MGADQCLACADASVPVYWVLLVGDASVGKSSMIQRFTLDSFSPDIKATEGASGKQKEIQLKRGPARLQVCARPPVHGSFENTHAAWCMAI